MAAEQTTSLTQTCPACAVSIDTTGLEPLARVICPQCGEKVRVERSFNNFVLLETLGIGGMGTVYKARDTLLDRDVALKLLRDDLGTEIDHAARLQQEARVAASVNHPNVVQVFSSGSDHGKIYLVMELVDQGSLDDWIEEQKRLPEELVLEVGIQVAKGLRAAHAKGLIHRDVKPANILFADENTAKIGDFGLAGLVAETAESRGEIWGTPYYVAPERLNNEPEDFRSDIYSLGATLFHAAAGQAPIEGETNSAITLRELKNHPLELRAVAPEISPETARVLARMIAPDPEKRFASYDELVSELEHVAGKDEVDLARVRKMRRMIVAGAIAAVAIVAAISWHFVQKSRQQARLAVASAAKNTGIPISELERQLADARHQLVTGKHNVARAAFSRIATDARGRQPIYDWARLHEGLAAMIAREPSDARKAFQDIERTGRTGFANDNIDLANFFLATARTLLAPATVSANNVASRSNGEDAFAAFLFALKDITQLDINNAVPLLERFLAAPAAGKAAWIADCKPLAQKYLDDCRLYAAWKSSGAAQGNAATVADLRKKLKTRSAISEEMSGAEKKVPARDKKPAASAEKQAVPADLAQKKAQWLADWKNTLIADLNRAHFSGPMTDVSGAQFTGIEAANAQTLSLRTPYGIVQAPWAKLPAQTLLAISTSFINSSSGDAADRQWLCAVFAGASGQKEAAQRLAESAAQAKPEYRSAMSIVTAGSGG